MLSNLKNLFCIKPSLSQLFRVSNDDDFEEFLKRIFEEAINSLEQEAKLFNGGCEEMLSAYLKGALSIPDVLEVVREGYSNGRVDLTLKLISSSLPKRRLVEAKIYKGFSTHADAINQLLSRYSTGRLPSGYVLEYVKKPDITGIVKRLRERSDHELPELQQGSTIDYDLKWGYESQHLHGSGENIKVIHLNVNLYRP